MPHYFILLNIYWNYTFLHTFPLQNLFVNHYRYKYIPSSTDKGCLPTLLMAENFSTFLVLSNLPSRAFLTYQNEMYCKNQIFDPLTMTRHKT